MATYNFREDRCKIFKRSDGKEIVLLPSPYCQLCASPIQAGYAYTTGKCHNCYRGKTPVDGKNLSKIYATSLYIPRTDHTLNEEIRQCKDNLSYVDELTEVLECAIKTMFPELQNYGALVPIPRGTINKENHMRHIANKLSGIVNIPVLDPLYRKSAYGPQSKLKTRAERMENVKDKIGCKGAVFGKIILLDDICTSGHTMLNSAKALREKGAEKVVGLAIARDSRIKNLLHAGILEEVEEDAE